MIVIAKRFETYVSLRNLSLSLGKIHCPTRKVPFFSLGEFDPFLNQNSLFQREVVFFTTELFLLHGELV
jgi:hypothetical protein